MARMGNASGTDPIGPSAAALRRETDDEALLHSLGYAQELSRGMGGFRNFAISFSIVSIIAGCLPSYFVAFHWGGPVSVTWGWLVVGCFTIFVALSMAEIASAYPTAGGLYYWSAKLGGPGWSWFTGWFNLLGLVGAGAVGYGLATFSAALFNMVWGYPTDRHHIFYLFAAFSAAAILVNVFDVRITSALNAVSVYWHLIGVAIIVAALFAVPGHHQSARYVFTQTINNSGLPGQGWGSLGFLMVVAIGSIGMAQFTLVGYDASAHMAEETRGASRAAATGMVMAVVVSVVCGFVLLLAMTSAIPDRVEVQKHFGDIAAYIWSGALSDRWAEALLLIVVCAQFFCLAACFTAGSRLLFALSRDRAVPGHRAWRRLSRRRVPVGAVVAVGITSFLVLLPTWWDNLAGYYAATSIGATSLYIAYIQPVILRLRKGSGFQRGAWSLGRHHRWINVIAICWVVVISIVFMLPTSPGGMPWRQAFDPDLVNYAPLTIGGAFLLFGGWYLLFARKWFRGPIPMGTEEQLTRLEATLEPQFAVPAERTRETG
jgi:amino acid transporter